MVLGQAHRAHGEEAVTIKTEWKVEDGRLDVNNMWVRFGCHHRKGADACGGCYARLAYALEEIQRLVRSTHSSTSVAQALGSIDALIEVVSAARIAEKKP